MSDQWYYSRDGQEDGPFPYAVLQQMAKVGDLLATDKLRGATAQEWRVAADFPDLFVTVEPRSVSSDSSSLKGLTMALGIEPAKPGHDPLLGCDIGGVTIEKLIAEGGMGRVYEGLQERPKRRVAVKVMRPGFVSRETSQRFAMELEILGRLRHPYIAQIYSAGICDVVGSQVPFFVLEYIPDALPITRYAKEKLLGIDARIALFQKVCEAVAHGHEQGIVHRDLKPGNILVEPNGIPKIIDFGIARTVSDTPEKVTALTELGQLIGTIQYMSPEQIDGDPAAIDQRTDVYALGVILYELLTGVRPYEISRDQIFDAGRIIRKQKPVSPLKHNQNLRSGVVKIAGTCLQKDRAKRFTNAADLSQALGRYLATEAVAGVPSTPAIGKPWLKWSLLATGFLMACIGVGVYGFRGWPERPAPSQKSDDSLSPSQIARPIVFLADLLADVKSAHYYNNKTTEPVGGKVYSESIHVHPDVKTGTSVLSFSLGGLYADLRGAVGIWDEAKPASPQVFRIIGDGKELWESLPTKEKGAGESFVVDVSSVKVLELQTSCEGRSKYGAQCVWIDPQLTKREQAGQSGQAGDQDQPRPSPTAADNQAKRPSPVPVTAPLRDAIRFFRNHAYWFPATQSNRTEAQTLAGNLGGSLIIIEDEAENAFVAGHAHGPTWLGIERVQQEWRAFANRDKASFTKWDQGLPSSNTDEVAAATTPSGLWRNHLPTDSLYYAVEWPEDKLPFPMPLEIPDAPETSVTYVADLPVQLQSCQWFHNRITWNPIGGTMYKNAMHIHPPVRPNGKDGESRLVYAIEGKYDELVGAVGVLDFATRIASLQTFQIIGDERELWKSAPFKQTGQGESFCVNVSGVKILELRVSCTGSVFAAHCVWIDPRLITKQSE